MENNKQTAVEWLYNKIVRENTPVLKFPDCLKQAKQMEKEQIIEAFKHGELPPLFVNYNSEQYYNETFKSE